MPPNPPQQLPPAGSRASARLSRDNAAKFALSFTLFACIVFFAMFVHAISVGGVVPPSENSTIGPSFCHLIELGAKYTPAIIRRGQDFRILSSTFLHSGVVSFLVTLALQASIMFPFELEHGKLLTAFLFILCSLCGNGFSMVGTPLQVSTGPLSGILGLVGFSVTCQMLNPVTYHKISAREVFSIIAVVLLGQTPFVDNYAALAGFSMGSFWAGVFYADRVQESETPFLRYLVMAVSLVSAMFILFICFFLSFGSSYRSVDQLMVNQVCNEFQDPVPFF
ncbi:hypothetical protein BASA81_001072 [Batrachochytrium salamandrivorans]|nr:hypothetical protein BASA81_001072 [Batrachochytrium salamandrivorans]